VNVICPSTGGHAPDQTDLALRGLAIDLADVGGTLVALGYVVGDPVRVVVGEGDREWLGRDVLAGEEGDVRAPADRARDRFRTIEVLGSAGVDRESDRLTRGGGLRRHG
jgi:hypothetical protein